MRVSARKVVIEKKMSSAVKNDGFNQNSPGLNQQTCGFDQHKSEFHQEQLVLTIFQGKKSACSLVKSISVHDFPWRPHHFWHVDHISPEFFQAISATFHHVPRWKRWIHRKFVLLKIRVNVANLAIFNAPPAIPVRLTSSCPTPGHPLPVSAASARRTWWTKHVTRRKSGNDGVFTGFYHEMSGISVEKTHLIIQFWNGLGQNDKM